ncbi:MAG TPA: sigma-70 family RNA polymerase sigma factor [Limnobacter sp.]|uniref:RNA polymerase sigma factor n=1 Tax=Limnobacter sp. TaxID=2003368 RepID=UPI002E382047|nr:sigma-70 family RNA polymerase sigma factor [Limnobacter sp.]HEX5486572.1 sigma-70 family RNA polymerase sigma factor [Limnobacter sp.]
MTDFSQTSVQASTNDLAAFAAESYAQFASIENLPALEKLLIAQRSRLTHFIRKHLKKDEMVEDLLQQTHIAAFRSWERFRGESKPETWLFGIAMNLVRNSRVRDVYANRMVDDSEEQLMSIPTDPSEEPVEILQRAQQMGLLKEAIASLPVRMQEAVQLVFLEGVSYQDAAIELDLPIGTIRSRLSRARDLLRARFEM